MILTDSLSSLHLIALITRKIAKIMTRCDPGDKNIKQKTQFVEIIRHYI